MKDVSLLRKNLEGYFGHLKTTDRATREEVAEIVLDVILGENKQTKAAEDDWEVMIVGNVCTRGTRGIPDEVPMIRIAKTVDDVAKTKKPLYQVFSIQINKKALDYLDDIEYIHYHVLTNGNIVLSKGKPHTGRKIIKAGSSAAFSVNIPETVTQYLASNTEKYLFNEYIAVEATKNPQGTKCLVIRPIK